jgi:hypothetical protein
MSRFKFIDNRLSELANKLGAKLTKNRPGYPEALRIFEERRIDWNDDEIRKAIIIQPNFEATGVNSTIWNFINIAWLDDAHSVKKLKWIDILVDKGEFRIIEQNIEELLLKSEENLKKIRREDLH